VPIPLAMTATKPARSAGSVSRSLRAAFGLLLLTLLVAGTAGVFALTAQTEAAERLLYRTGQVRIETLRAQQGLTDAETGMRGYVLTGDAELLVPYERGRVAFRRHLDAAANLLDSDTSAGDDLNAMRRTGDRWLREFAQPAIAARRAAATGPLHSEGKALFDQFRQAADHTNAVLEAERETDQAAIADRATLGRSALIATMLAGTALCALVSLRTARRIIGPLDRLHGTIDRLRIGDTSARADLEGPAEIRAVATTLNTLAAENDTLSTLQRDRVQRERTIREVAGRIREHLDVDGVLQQAVTELGLTLGTQRVAVRLLEDGRYGPFAAEWTAEGVPRISDVEDALPEIDESIHHRIMDTVAVDDSSVSDPSQPGPTWQAFWAANGIRAVMLSPVMAGASVSGLLVVHEYAGPRRWTASEIAIVEAIARELGAALSHAQAYERERHMVAKLQELDNAKSEFVSSVSHELRTPLTSIVGYLELLLEGEGGPLEAEQLRMLEVIGRNSRRLLALIEDLLTLSRIESGAFKVSMTPIELPPLVDAVVESVKPTVDARKLELVVDVPARTGTILGDEPQLERVLLNLITNALKFTPEGGRVTLSARPVGDSIALSVADTGIGIPASEQPKLFSRFFRSSISQERAIQGTGLGLVIVKSIVEHHGGSIWFTSKPGEGTTFTVTLPLTGTDAPGAAMDRVTTEGASR
jgi:two-component system phosphate regulon sensor histidine kinase PhoR